MLFERVHFLYDVSYINLNFYTREEMHAMAEKRRDNKNRILRSGESQRKDGRYVYKYMDALGKTRFAYAWKLVSTDKIPVGKRDDLSLREKEFEIQKDIHDGIDIIGKKMTVCELYAKQTRQRGNVRYNTVQGRNRLMSLLMADKLGACTIENVKQSDAKEWVLRMKEKGISYKTISNDKRSLKAAFYAAIQDDCLRKNPFDFQLSTVIQDDTEPKRPLTPEQEKALLAFIREDNVYYKYYHEVIILLGTGLRISELCGLTDYDLDFDNRIIRIDHQLLRRGSTGYYIEKPKTQSGIRQIPMTEQVYTALQCVMKSRKSKKKITISNYSNFLFLNQNGYPKTACVYDNMFRRLIKKYNKGEKIALPKVMTPHTLRHTFCTNLANAGMNPKALQYIMGHSNIAMTLDYYAHATFDSARDEMKRLIT